MGYAERVRAIGRVDSPHGMPGSGQWQYPKPALMDQAIQPRPCQAQFRLQKLHRQLEHCRHWLCPPPHHKRLDVAAAVSGNYEAAQPMKLLAKRVERAVLRVRSKRQY